jgi:hypothetical protein
MGLAEPPMQVGDLDFVPVDGFLESQRLESQRGQSRELGWSLIRSIYSFSAAIAMGAAHMAITVFCIVVWGRIQNPAKNAAPRRVTHRHIETKPELQSNGEKID